MSHCDAISLEDFSAELKPIVRIINDWVTNRRLALIFEVQAGNGKLLVCGADLFTDNETRPEAQQLLMTLKMYAASEKFNPIEKIDIKKINSLFH